MTELTPATVFQFLRRFQFRGGRLRQFRVRNARRNAATGDLIVSAVEHATGKKVRLRFTFEGVEEYRFQRRPGAALARLTEVQVGFFGTLVYVNLDPFPVDGPPKVMDYRASDCFMAGRLLRWAVVEPRPTTA